MPCVTQPGSKDTGAGARRYCAIGRNLRSFGFFVLSTASIATALLVPSHTAQAQTYQEIMDACRRSGGTWIQTATHDYCVHRTQSPAPRASTNAADDAARRQREAEEQKRLEQQRREQEQRDQAAKAAAARAAEEQRQRDFIRDRDDAFTTLKGASGTDSGLKGESTGTDGLKEVQPANTSGYSGELKKVEEEPSAGGTDPEAEKVLAMYLGRDSRQAGVSFSAYSFKQQMRIVRPVLKSALSDRELDVLFRMLLNMREFPQLAPVMGITIPQTLRQQNTRADYARSTAIARWNALPRQPSWKSTQIRKMIAAYEALPVSVTSTSDLQSGRALNCAELEVARERDLAGCSNQYQNVDNHKLAACTNKAISAYQQQKDKLNCNR